MLRIVCWLNTIKLSQDKPDEYFLSQDEIEKVINYCLVDIDQGLAFINDHPDWITITVRRGAKLNASLVVDWAIALIILLMSVTGLRRQSLMEIEIGDWVQIYPDMYALAYHHGKVNAEKVVAVPGLVIKALEQYAKATDTIRQGLPTKRLFLKGNVQGFWCIFKNKSALKSRLYEFVERHCIRRNGAPVNISPGVMRRTYATRELYDGRSLNVIRIQLGHIRQTTTEHYTKFDRYEHPAHVRNALDRYGRLALTTWKNPVILEDLSPAERQLILSDRRSRDQDVGLCRHDHCVKVQHGGAPPCSLCEHLATGPEFLGAWRSEHEERLAEIKGLSEEACDAHNLAEKQYQLRRFEANLVYVKQSIAE
jgi:integrase